MCGSAVVIIKTMIIGTIERLKRVNFCVPSSAIIALKIREIKQIMGFVICVMPAVMAVNSIKYIITIPIYSFLFGLMGAGDVLVG